LFLVPPVNILYTLFMDNVLIKTFTPNSVYTDMGNTTTWIDTLRSFVQTGLVNGENHTFTVTCSYNHAQFPSKSMPLITIANKTLSSFDLPSAPVNLSISNITDNSVQLNWDALSTVQLNGTLFNAIEVFKNDMFIGISEPDKNYFVVSNLSKGVKYNFTIRVSSSRNELTSQSFKSLYSTFAPTMPYSVPSPVIVTSSVVLNESIQISWLPSSDMGGYNVVSRYSIQYRLQSDNTWIEASSVSSPATISGLQNGYVYEFKLN